MRVHIRIDSATTKELRAFTLEHRRATSPNFLDITEGHGPQVVVEGPECWGAQGSPIPLEQAIQLLGNMRSNLTPLVHEPDPELEKLLAEEEEIERAARDAAIARHPSSYVMKRPEPVTEQDAHNARSRIHAVPDNPGWDRLG